MRRMLRAAAMTTLLLAALVGCAAACLRSHAQIAPVDLQITSAPPGETERPNILFILTDDLSFRLVKRHLESYPNIATLAQSGVTFNRFFTTTSACCPSRATFLTGQYSHNHGVKHNDGSDEAALHALESKSLAVWLKEAGYATGYYGRYLNGYDGYTPPGWDEWRGRELVKTNHPVYHHTIVGYGLDGRNKVGKTHTQVFSEEAASFIKRHPDKPFFVYYAPYSPHLPAAYPKKYESMFRDLKAPRSDAFNEANVSDKPRWVRSRPAFTKAQAEEIDEQYRGMVRAMKDVDDAVGRLVSTLKEAGELSNTYIVFASDNGYHHGTHRLDKKWTPYMDASRVPLVVDGPNETVAQNAQRTAMIANTDLAPTFAQWADADPMLPVDGRSFAPLLKPDAPTDSSIDRREYILLEGVQTLSYPRPAYAALRTKDGLLYVEYGGGSRELYNLAKDPLELENKVGQRPTLEHELSTRLDALVDCSGSSCKETENTP
jgi:N-acetylglucosamine-6-sulfatase